jgi:chromosome segregation ATPase
MANSTELAQQAFSLLNDALRNSEERVAELDAELKRKRAPKNRVEQQAEVLGHRLETAEADCERWKREASSLEEILENERVKIAQLKKKLEVAESGPTKLTKKEVNFWRQRAEEFDTATRDYKKRIAGLRAELRKQIGVSDLEADIELGAALESAEKNLAELRAKLTAGERELETQKQHLREKQAEEGKLSTTLAERDAHIAKISAELEKTRAALTSGEQRAADLARELAEKAELARNAADKLVALDKLAQEHEKRGTEINQLREAESAARSHRDELHVALAEREAQFQALAKDLKDSVADGDQQKGEIQELAQQIDAAAIEIAERESEVSEVRNQLDAKTAELRDGIAALDALRDLQPSLQAEIAELKASTAAQKRELRQLQGLTGVEKTEQTRVIETLNNLISQRDEKVAQLEELNAQYLAERSSVRDQIAALEEELKEEKECTVNVSQLANERREEIEQLVEKLEEAEERYEEAKWRLGKAAYFEKLVGKRKKLVKAIIEKCRAKAKSNTALKAGLDGLRTFKATSEQNQQKLLARTDKLSSALKEARETVAQHHGNTISKAELAHATERVGKLEERVATQLELIETLESELKHAKISPKGPAANAPATDDQIQKLIAEVDRKDEAIRQLEADVDDQNKKLAKLRGSESETMRLKALKEQDHSQIGELQGEIAALKAKLNSAVFASSNTDEAADQITREKDKEIGSLEQLTKEQKREIAKLTEAVNGWQKKYEFISTEAPSAYQSVVVEK